MSLEKGAGSWCLPCAPRCLGCGRCRRQSPSFLLVLPLCSQPQRRTSLNRRQGCCVFQKGTVRVHCRGAICRKGKEICLLPEPGMVTEIMAVLGKESWPDFHPQPTLSTLTL